MRDRPRRMYAAVLAALVVVGLVLLLPLSVQFAATRPNYQQSSGWGLASGVALQATLAYVVIMLGVKLGPAVDLGWPPLVGWHDGTRSPRRAIDALSLAALLGALPVLPLALASTLVTSAATVPFAGPVAPWVFALASVGAGIWEEVVFRLGVMTIVAWLLSRFRMGVIHPVAAMWSANFVAAILFGAAHLPNLSAGAATPAVVAFIFAGNGIVGLMCGWLFWRKGLIAAMTAHAMFDLVHKVLLPALGGFFG